MSESELLQQLSAERAALAASQSARVAAIAVSPRRSVSAIAWRPGLFVSAAEALAGADQVHIRAGAAGAGTGEAVGEVLAADPATDVAVIRCTALQGMPIPVMRSDALRLAESVLLIGHGWHGPMACFASISMAAEAWRSRRGGHIDQRIEIAAPPDERLEGAAIVDMAGRLVAMAVAGAHGRTLGIPASTVERVLAAVVQRGYLPRPYLGLRLQRLWLDAAAAARFGRHARRIPVVAGVDPDSPAAVAGLEPGDLIETVDDHPVHDIDTLRQALSGPSLPRTLTLGIRRGGLPQQRTLTPIERAPIESAPTERAQRD